MTASPDGFRGSGPNTSAIFEKIVDGHGIIPIHETTDHHLFVPCKLRLALRGRQIGSERR
jgi:hypothetical protein